ncbi:hypothetical protein CEY12_01710 [Chryseobacterium sp. T16E-39]|uniref:hypothetical protein n=1 Tax=Chryseobacterium sp. T16E-39 TaxID=2015076 RepID=UPI000B5B36FB|nr:hypothetical protein [Chryseobacterium sp. T16E-39]ASK32639.1 hypothetical protein CEY12_01710 [Chryseobacterium sp. T16E-39]
MKKAGIIGYGWLGSRIAEKLSEKFEIYTTTTTSDKEEYLNKKGFHPCIINFPDYLLSEKHVQWEAIKELDVLIITIPISGKNCCASSLYNRIQNLFSFIGDFNGQIFLMSSTGVYPDLDQELKEEDMSSDNVPGERMIKNKYPQVNILRLAGLMGEDRFLSKYRVSNLNFFTNHIHYVDIGLVLEKMIDQKSQSKIYNVVAPLHPTKSEVINAQKNLENAEITDDPKGKKISSAKLISELDFIFKYPDPKSFHEMSSTE